MKRYTQGYIKASKCSQSIKDCILIMGTLCISVIQYCKTVMWLLIDSNNRTRFDEPVSLEQYLLCKWCNALKGASSPGRDRGESSRHYGNILSAGLAPKPFVGKGSICQVSVLQIEKGGKQPYTMSYCTDMHMKDSSSGVF